jgi:intracellular septation protein A
VNDVIFPSTDAGVAVQLILVTLVFATAVWLMRRRPEVRTLIIGLWVLTYGAAGLRALH